MIQEDDLATCAGIEEEVLRILEQKFERNPETIRDRMAPFWDTAIRVETTGEVKGVSRDPGDDFVIECAVNSGAHILISGDNDLLSLSAYGSVRILTPRQYLSLHGRT